MDEGDSRFWQSFIIFGQSSMKRDPGKRTFNYPSFRQDLKRVFFRSFNDFQRPLVLYSDPLYQFPHIATVSKDFNDSVEIFIFQSLHYCSSANTIMDIGSMYHDYHYQSQGINNHVTFSSFNLLPAVISHFTFTKIASLHALTVNYSNSGRRVFASADSDLFNKKIMEFFYQTISFPFTEIVIDRLPRCKFLGKHSPLYSAFNKVYQRIHDLMKRIFSLSLVRINNIFNNLPLAFGQICWIGFHVRLFFSPLQTDENSRSVFEGLFTFYSHSIVNQHNEKYSANF